MKTVALIHTVKRVADTFEEVLRAGVDETIRVYNLLDDYLANHPNEVGEFTINNRNRLFQDLKTQEMTGADLIVTTCSTLTPVVDMLRPLIKVPVIAIDDAMASKGVTYGRRILIMATAESTVEPTREKLKKEAAAAGIEIDLDQIVCREAFHAMKELKMNVHDNILREEAGKIRNYDCVILAQASMAHLQKDIQEISKIVTLSSPSLCIRQINEYFKAEGVYQYEC